MRMRGLKAYMPMQTGNFIQVATHAYAWLEGALLLVDIYTLLVATHAYAWLEGRSAGIP